MNSRVASAITRCLSAAALGIAATAACAQSYPSKTMRIIAPFSAGGAADLMARYLCEKFPQSMGQPCVVENRTGAGGMIGVQAVASAAPDGYTFGITNVSTLSLIPVLNPKNAYHPLNDFTHVAYVAGAPVSLAVFPKTGVKTLAEFIAFANKSARPLTFASSGLGSDGHLIGEAIAASTKIKVEHIPYKSTGQALTDVVGGHVTFSTFTLSSSSSFIRAGTITGIAVTSPERMPDYPELPTFKELGYPDVVSTIWFSLSGPAGLPEDIVRKLNREIARAVNRPEVQQRLKQDGFVTEPMTLEEFARFIDAENERWRPILQQVGLSPG